MEMCPYCGEDVPDDSTACWKCGTEIQRSGAGGGDGSDQIQQRNLEGKSGPKAECPFCQALISPRAMRCNECGKPLTKTSGRANWVPAAWAAFGIVLLASVAAVVVSFAKAHRAAPDPGRLDPVSRDFQDLERIYLKAGGNETRRREIWRAEHEGKYVEWEGVILEVEPDLRVVRLAQSGLTDKPQTIVEMKADQDLTDLKRDKSIRYSARLDDFRDGQFHLSMGQLIP
jgi:hypothetical protein